MSLFRKIWLTRNYRISFILAVLMTLWLASGVITGQSVKDEDTQDVEEEIAKVKARILQAETIPLNVRLQATTEPNRAVHVKAEVSGTVTAVPVEKGAYVEMGEVICELDVEDRQEILQQARAALEKAEIDYEGAQRLQAGAFQSKSASAEFLAVLETARANYKRAQLNLENTNIRAPFAGFVDARPVEVGDLMQVGDTCARVLDIDPILVTASVSESAVTNVVVGGNVEASLITGDLVQGTVRFVERSADEITRRFRVEAVVPNPERTIFSGLSGYMIVPTGETKAHRINSSLLILADSGEIGVKILDEDNHVRFVIIELVADDGSGVWVSGLPDTTTLITLGQQYVAEGEQVEVTFETDASEEAAIAQ